ncbi:MAG: hypothetical protein PHV23_01240 [Candidatus Gracilibacteria bacterium]|nr:hypothetical protein [Candidatus Gracilibacteria bacterium]
MENKNKKGSIFIYVLILVNVALIIGYVVFNNTYILNNNINIGKNAEEVFLKLSDKANINIESVRQYNRNGGGFTDFISCPDNITMSGNTNSGTNINSEMNYDLGTVYCSFDYNYKNGRLYFSDETKDFSSVYYNGELLKIDNLAFGPGAVINNGTISIYSSTSYTSSDTPAKSFDGNNSTQYRSTKSNYPQITYDLGSPKKLAKLIIYKSANTGTSYRDNGIVNFLSSSNAVLKSVSLNGIGGDSNIVIDLSYANYASADDIKYIQIISNHTNRYLTVSEIQITELIDYGTPKWSSIGYFNDGDNTEFSFAITGVGGVDNVDDNMDSDNYRSTSTGSIGYPGNFFDDDIIPRLTIFGNIGPNMSDYYNVFWNNYITNEIINNNVYNNDNPLSITKIGDVTEGYLIFDLFSKTDLGLNYNMKIIEFDKLSYKDRFTLLPINVIETFNMSDTYGYLQKNGEVLSFSRYKTGNEFKFDFKNKDYAIFFTNNLGTNMAVRITGEEKPSSGLITDIGKMIYINPIDDSKPNVIETVANHIIIGGEKNFIGENFKVVGAK